jgi:hypothetical protein
LTKSDASTSAPAARRKSGTQTFGLNSPAAQRRAAEQQRLLAARLENDLRAAFSTANPAATEEDFERLWPQIRDDHMRAAAAVGAENVFDRIRNECGRRRQEELDRRSRFEQLPERT